MPNELEHPQDLPVLSFLHDKAQGCHAKSSVVLQYFQLLQGKTGSPFIRQMQSTLQCLHPLAVRCSVVDCHTVALWHLVARMRQDRVPFVVVGQQDDTCRISLQPSNWHQTSCTCEWHQICHRLAASWILQSRQYVLGFVEHDPNQFIEGSEVLHLPVNGNCILLWVNLQDWILDDITIHGNSTLQHEFLDSAPRANSTVGQKFGDPDLIIANGGHLSGHCFCSKIILLCILPIKARSLIHGPQA
mmetsp:Transcript_60934/g.96491  ORF Transcript_60934/g.96491 Transcript_60934/m.96491 type:complete len:245 (+) Transcript_60934:565-1299(+)